MGTGKSSANITSRLYSFYNSCPVRLSQRGMMSGREEIIYSLFSRSMNTKKIASSGKNHRLIQHDPVFDPITKKTHTCRDKVAKPLNNITVYPTALFFQLIGKIPMIKRDPWSDANFQRKVNHAVVEIYSFIIYFTDSCRKDPAPRNRKTMIGNIHSAHQAKIAGVAVIKIARNITMLILKYFISLFYKNIPDRFAF